MSKQKTSTIAVRGTAVSILTGKDGESISLTDIARYKDAERTDYLISNWLRNRDTVELLGIWGSFITPVLIPSNSMGLKSRRD